MLLLFRKLFRRRRRRISLLRLAAALTALSFGLSLSTACAAAGFAAGASQAVVIVDVKHIFENCRDFTQAKKRLQVDVNLADVDTKIEQARISAMAEELKALKAGSDEHTALQGRIIEAQAGLQVSVQRYKSEFVRRESELYWQAYQRVQYVVHEAAAERGAALVLRFTRENVDAHDPQSVMRGLNNPIVSFEEHVDITDDVLRRINNLRVVMEPIDLK